MTTRVLDWSGLVAVANRKKPEQRIIAIAGVPARVVRHLAVDAGFYVRTLDEDHQDTYWALRSREEMRLLRALVGHRVVTIEDDADPWRLDEWHDRLRFEAGPRCFVAGCTATEVDQRGPIFARDPLLPHQMLLACPAHWEAVMGVVGAQQADPAGPEQKETGEH